MDIVQKLRLIRVSGGTFRVKPLVRIWFLRLGRAEFIVRLHLIKEYDFFSVLIKGLLLFIFTKPSLWLDSFNSNFLNFALAILGSIRIITTGFIWIT